MNQEEKILEELKRVGATIDGIIKEFYGSSFKYILERAQEIIPEFYKRCSPFKEGELVEIAEPIDFYNAPGRRGSEHDLVVGAKGRVYSVEFWEGTFKINIILNTESYVGLEGKKVFLDDDMKHIFCFGEKQLKKVKEKNVST